MSREKDQGGRPTKYKPEYAGQAREMIRWGGFSYAKLAKIFGVGETTVKDWRKAHADFDDAVREGKDLFNVKEAERCLLKLVKGYRYREKKFERVPVFEGEGEEKKIAGWEMVATEERTRMVGPNVRAITLYLQSRDPERWPNKQRHEVSGVNGEAMVFEIKTGVERGPGDD